MASKYPPKPAADNREVIERDTLLEFPCKFPIKAMGVQHEGFKAMIVEIVQSHAQLHADEQVTISPSGSGKYISVTVTIEATSKDQLDRIYQDLTDCTEVLVAL